MKITLTLKDGSKHDVKTTDGAPFAEADCACPACGDRPLKHAGRGRSIESHDTYRADASCVSCGAAVGVVRAKVETIFGLEEDEAVLVHGRPRVYG